MDIKRNDIVDYINGYPVHQQNADIIKMELYELYSICGDENKKYVIDINVNAIVNDNKKNNNIYNARKMKLEKLKLLELPEQRSPEWYEMRKEKLTASSIASAIGKCHFTTREELILSKIEDKPYESNPITEWGVKYEDIAILFYEEMYNVKVLDFGLIPHPTFQAFGASPDGICDDTGNDEYLARMVEIKCPPKRKFTKTCPPHYLMQVQGQLEVCDLDHCDFFQVKIEDYEDYDDYSKDYFLDDDKILPGRTHLNYPKGVTVSYRKKDAISLTYLYPSLNMTDEGYKEWIKEKKIEILNNGDEYVESKWWKITRYECTLIQRDYNWWNENVENILKFYTDLKIYKSDPKKLIELKKIIAESKKRKSKKEIVPNDFALISDEEDN
jgi:putative phage-type endonuclease